MKTQSDATIEDHDLVPPHPSTWPRRLHTFMQTLVAVLVVGLLLGGFLVLFATRHIGTGTGSRTATSTSSGSHPIVIASTEDGTIYAPQPKTGTILWHYATSKQSSGGLSPELVIQGQIVYFVDGNHVYALHAANGTLLWQKDLPFTGGFGNLNVDNGVLYVSNGEVGADDVYALQVRDGNILWHQTIPGRLLTANNGKVYVQEGIFSSKATIQALQGTNGQILWSYNTNVLKFVEVRATNDAVYIYPLHIQGKTMYSSLAALSTKDGHLLWSRSITEPGGQPFLVDRGMIFIGTIYDSGNSYHLCAYRTSDGIQVWCLSKTTPAFPVSITIDNSTLYSITTDVTSPLIVDARSTIDSSLRWSHTLPKSAWIVNIVSINGNVYAIGGYTTYALSGNDGHILWQFHLSKRFTAIAAGAW